MIAPPLIVLTDRHQLPEGRELESTVERCAEAGATTVLLRELDLPATERAALVPRLSAHVDVLVARTPVAGASGVHLGSRQARADAGGRRHGRSCHDEDEVRRAVDEGARWLTVSPVASTASKPGYGPPLGRARLGRLVSLAAGTPVYALGGVEASSVAELVGSGVHGVAVMGAVMRAPDPGAVVAALLAELGER